VPRLLVLQAVGFFFQGYTESISSYNPSDEYGHTRIEQFIIDLTLLRIEGDLAEPMVGSGAGGFCVEVDEHGNIFSELG
jgi:hypothetical protein